MKQLIQNIKNGQTSLADVPPPALRPGGMLVRSEASLISAGTERMMLKLAKKSLLGKAKERPDLVKKVLDKVRRDGLLAAFETVRQQLDRDVAVGYSLCGRVEDVGAAAGKFSPGQRVACAGAGYATFPLTLRHYADVLLRICVLERDEYGDPIHFKHENWRHVRSG